MQYPQVAFIGAGHMAGYIIKGLVSSGFPADHIVATRRTPQALSHLQSECNIRVTTDNHDAVKQAEIVILGVKPAGMKTLVESLSPDLQKKKPLLVSIAAGIRVDDIIGWAGGDLPAIRVMPNLPASVRSGVSSLFASKLASETDRQKVAGLFSSVGVVCWMEKEQHMDIATVLGGSGPALFYRFLESLISGAVAHGIATDTAQKMALGTGIGALELLHQGNDSPETLRSHVTSPGGTTAAALSVLEDHGLQTTIEKALDAGVKRAEELAMTY